MKTIILALTLLAAAALVLADDYPRRKPGLWEMTMAGEAEGAKETRSSRLCTDRAFEDLMIKKGMDTIST